jgi:hypothetical protein
MTAAAERPAKPVPNLAPSPAIRHSRIFKIISCLPLWKSTHNVFCMAEHLDQIVYRLHICIKIIEIHCAFFANF